MEIPPEWFAEPLRLLQEAASENTDAEPHFVVTCSSEFGLRVGLAPGTVSYVLTPAGSITVKVERST